MHEENERYRVVSQCHTIPAFSFRSSRHMDVSLVVHVSIWTMEPYHCDRYRWSVWENKGDFFELSPPPKVLSNRHPEFRYSWIVLIVPIQFFIPSCTTAINQLRIEMLG